MWSNYFTYLRRDDTVLPWFIVIIVYLSTTTEVTVVLCSSHKFYRILAFSTTTQRSEGPVHQGQWFQNDKNRSWCSETGGYSFSRPQTQWETTWYIFSSSSLQRTNSKHKNHYSCDVYEPLKTKLCLCSLR